MNTFAKIVEVGPRDGFQSIKQFIDTETKIKLIRRLYGAGIRHMEVTSFVSPTALPQLADAETVLRAAQELDGLDCQVLVPTARHAERALRAGARHLAFVLSVSEAHNRSNVRRHPLESVQDYAALVAMIPTEVEMRVNLAAAFDCPFDGKVSEDTTLALASTILGILPTAEVALCDTTGRATPGHVSSLFAKSFQLRPDAASWAFHAHDTYGLGAANTLTAWNAGVRCFDAAVAGLGGCPFAPGATGNVATEDLIWMFDGMDIGTAVDLQALVGVANAVADLPGAQVGGRARGAIAANTGLARKVTA